MNKYLIASVLLLASFNIVAENTSESILVNVLKGDEKTESLQVPIHTYEHATQNGMIFKSEDNIDGIDSKLEHTKEYAYIEKCEERNNEIIYTPGVYNGGVGAYAYKDEDEDVVVYVKNIFNTEFLVSESGNCAIQNPQSKVFAFAGVMRENYTHNTFNDTDGEKYKLEISLIK